MIALIFLSVSAKKMANTSANYSPAASTITSYIKNVSKMNKSIAYHYLSRLPTLKAFTADEYHSRLSVDNLVLDIKQGKQDPYKVEGDFSKRILK